MVCLTLQMHLDTEIAGSMVRLSKALIGVEQHVYNLYLMSYTGLRGISAHSVQSAERIRGVSKDHYCGACLISHCALVCYCNLAVVELQC